MQRALDAVMLRTQLQRLSVVAGGYGFLALVYGCPSSHDCLYTVHVSLGLLLILTSIVAFIRPYPSNLITLGVTLIIMGAWINVMARVGEAAGGSPAMFSAWGCVLIVVGAVALFDYRHFSYLGTQMPTGAEVKKAGTMVKKLLSANPKKQQDVLIVQIQVEEGPHRDVKLGEWVATLGNTGRWKAMLLPDVMVLVQNESARVLVLARGDLDCSTDVKTSGLCNWVVRISDRAYRMKLSGEFCRRVRDWLISDEGDG